MQPIRVLVVDDHLVVRTGIRALLATETGIVVVGEATNGVEAIGETRRLQPDVILMDLIMPELDGISAIGQIVADFPDAQILVLTSFGNDNQVFPAIRAGALGYTLKDLRPEELVRAIQRVHRGESSLHPTIARRVLQEAEVLASQRARGKPRSAKRWLSSETLLAWLFILPSLIGFIIFYAFPAGRGVWISFTNGDLLGTPKFIGIANYQKLLNDPQFWHSLLVCAIR